MKNVYFVQVDVSSDADSKVLYLPYAVGLIAASAWKDETVKREYSFKGFIYRRDDVDKAVARLESPYLIGFSNYCWNAEYNRLFARKVKELYPDCIIVFGGHDIPDDPDFLREFPFVDILMHGEGEYNFRALMRELVSGDISSVNDITYKDSEGSFIRTEKTAVPHELDDFPSPYLEGWYDDIIKENPDIVFNAILETSRGCPNQCAYCDWGLLRSKTRLFSLDRVLEEVRWMSRNKIAFIWGADANFGMFERDMLIVDELVRCKKENGYPEKMRMNYSKTNYERVFEISKKLCQNDCDRMGATLSFQSLSPEVLKNIGRKNMSFDFFMELLKKYREEHIKTYSELLLGLPGETYDSFIAGLGKLLEMGQHLVFEVYGCILLPNSQLGQKDVIEKFDIRTVKTELLRGHTTGEAVAIPEYNNLITSTSTMTREQWADASVFYWFLKGMHGNGLVRLFAIYLYYEKGVKYQDFYQSLIDYTRQHPDFILHDKLEDLFVKAGHMSRGEHFSKLTFKPLGDFIWNEHEYLVLYMLQQFDTFYEQLRDFLSMYDIPSDVLEDLMKYQKAIIRRPDSVTEEIELNFDLHEYFSRIYLNEKIPFAPCRHRLRLTDSHPHDNWAGFGKFVVWYGNMGWESYKDDIEKTVF